MEQKKNKMSLVVADSSYKAPMKIPMKKKKVLSEDDFLEGIEKIIERDFFPDIPKLEAQQEYYEALEKNDLVKLREIQMRFKRPETGASDLPNTPLTFETPEGRRKTTPAKKRPDTVKPGEEMTVEESIENLDQETSKAPSMRLDAFLARNTSEDSASFAEILEESDKKHRLKHTWLFEKEQEQLAEHEEMAALPSIEEQAAIKDKPTHLNTWQYSNDNTVMYVPKGVELSSKELIEQQKHKPRQIVHENTRFKSIPFCNANSKEAMVQAATFKALINQGKIGHDGKEIQAGLTPQINGYGFVGTPSPAPGVSESPLMTWGEIESTPARLDSNNESLVSSTPGPVFRIPDTPKRDRLALELSEKASKAHRAKKEEALKQVTRRFASPVVGSKIGLSSIERLNSMSPAAQRLASKRLGIRISTDKALAESYTPSPSHRMGGTPTPSRLTPGSSRRSRSSSSSVAGTPSSATPTSRTGSATPSSASRQQQEAPSLTDHLLDLPKRKRKAAAADFFD